MATSGTVSQTVFNTRKVIDHAFRRCRVPPQKITSEYIETAKDVLYLLLSTLCSKGIALWAIDKEILPIYYGRQTVICPVGTVDVLNANLRKLNRLEGTAMASEGDAEEAFDNDIDTACVQTTPAGNIDLFLTTATAPTNFGILPGSTGTWSIAVQVSSDGLTWESVYTDDEFPAVDGDWVWFDVEGIRPVSYVRLQAFDTTTLNVREFVVANNPQEIPVAKVNRDDYSNLPNKTFVGRPTEFWYNKQRGAPHIVLWPAPGDGYTFQQITLYVQRYIMDVGTLTQELEIPQRWYLAIINELAKELSMEIPEADAAMIPGIRLEAKMRMDEAWAGETDSSPTRITPNIRPYTA